MVALSVKMQPFSPVFPLKGSITEALYCLFLWSFKKSCVMESGWCLFPWSFKGINSKCLSYGFRQGKSWRKRLYLHCTAEMKQHQTMTGPNKASAISYDAAQKKCWLLFCLNGTGTGFPLCSSPRSRKALAKGTGGETSLKKRFLPRFFSPPKPQYHARHKDRGE